MNEGLADGASDFNVFSALNGDVNFQDLSSEVDDDATELNLVKAVASGEKINTSFAEESEAETTEEYLSDERRSEICQNVASAACASCAAAGTCPILRMRNFAEENLQPAAKEPESYLSALMDDGCDFVVAGYVSADNEEKTSESIEKNPSENEKPEFVSEKPAVKSEVSDDDASMRVSAESNEANKPTDDECLDSESASSENIPSAKIIKENIQPKINEESDETEAASQINSMDSEDVDEKVYIHKEDMSFEKQAPPVVDKENELPRELPIKKDSHIGDENNINSAPILEDSTPEKDLTEKVVSNETNSLPVCDFVQVNNEIDVAMDDNNNAPAETELSEEVTRESEELPTSKSEIIGQFIPDLKLADDEIGQNNIVDEVVKKVAEKTELTEEYSELVATDDCDEVKCSVKIEGSSDCCDDIDNVLSRDLNIPVFQEIPVSSDNSPEEKANYNCDEDDANDTNMSGVYPGVWADDSPLNPEDDKTSNSYGVNMFLPLVELLGFLAIKTSSIKQEIIIR